MGPRGSLGSEPWLLSGHETGLWHQERGSSSLSQNCLCSDHPSPQALVRPSPSAPQAGQVQEQRWIWKEWQKLVEDAVAKASNVST